MSKFLLTVIGIGCMAAATAQQVKLPVGKKFQMITEVKANNITSMMGQDMEMSSSSIVYIDHELKSSGTNKFSMSLIIKRITGNVSMMGQEQHFDSDDESVRSNPVLADALQSLGKETEVVVEDGKVSGKGELMDVMKTVSGNATDINDLGRVFLLLKESDIKVGYTWSSNTSADGSTTESNLSIEKITDKEIEIMVSSKVKIANTMNQNGMEIKQQTEGTVKATRVYDKATGLLISELSTGDIKGNMEVMGQQVPLSSKIETKTSVKLL